MESATLVRPNKAHVFQFLQRCTCLILADSRSLRRLAHGHEHLAVIGAIEQIVNLDQ
jgi:hypothetical protein